MPVHRCPVPACEFVTADVSDELATMMFKLHYEGSHNAPQQRPPKQESVRRPTIAQAVDGTSEEWSYFLQRWKDYKKATRLTGGDVVIQLLECCEEDLRKDLTRSAGGNDLTEQSEKDVL